MKLTDALNNFKESSAKGKEKKTMPIVNKMAIIMNNSSAKKNKLPFTDEQEQIIESDAESLKVRAFAGAGKTSTLEGYADKRTGKKGLFITFNKSIKQDAEKRFPKNVKCVTSHGIAYAKFGRELSHKLMGYTDWKDIFDKLKIVKPFGSADKYNRIYALLLMEAVNFYTNTDDLLIGVHHVTQETYRMIAKNKSLVNHLPPPSMIIGDAVCLWKAMIDPNMIEIRATHDTYLKLFQLSKPSLKYDFIMLDEAQDSNPALLDIFKSQKNHKVLVGDQYQSIYGFRNAVDAMNKIDTDKTLDLTKSFRFGKQVADFANTVLALRGETKQIIGMKDSDLVYYGKPQAPGNENIAYIARYNSTLLRQSVEYININSGSIFFAGTFNSLRPDLLLDLYNLKYKTGYISDVMLSTFNSYDDFVEIMEETNDIEWQGRIKILEEYGRNLPAIINAIKAREVKDISLAAQIYSTAHKSKGLEFDNVVLAADYYNTPMFEGRVPDKLYTKLNDNMNEELHVFYVAATRAKKSLNVPELYRDYYNDFNTMIEPKLRDLHVKKETYAILNDQRNDSFIGTLTKEREIKEQFYINRKREKEKEKKEIKNLQDDDDIFS